MRTRLATRQFTVWNTLANSEAPSSRSIIANRQSSTPAPPISPKLPDTRKMDPQRRSEPKSFYETPNQSHSIKPSSSSTTDSYRPKELSLINRSDVMFKLLFFTAAMIILPLGTYWFTLNYIFQGTLCFVSCHNSRRVLEQTKGTI